MQRTVQGEKGIPRIGTEAAGKEDQGTARSQSLDLILLALGMWTVRCVSKRWVGDASQVLTSVQSQA